jgi:hypothetical protein
MSRRETLNFRSGGLIPDGDRREDKVRSQALQPYAQGFLTLLATQGRTTGHGSEAHKQEPYDPAVANPTGSERGADDEAGEVSSAAPAGDQIIRTRSADFQIL